MVGQLDNRGYVANETVDVLLGFSEVPVVHTIRLEDEIVWLESVDSEAVNDFVDLLPKVVDIIWYLI